MPKVSQKSQARYGTPIRTHVMAPVAAALLAEAGRTKRSVGHTAGEIIRYWYEDVYLPTQKLQEKK